jgi:PAS domain-containing protein
MAGTRDIYDWRQLQKWGIPESRLPEGSEIRYREVGFVEQNIGKVIVISAVIIMQLILIAYLLVNRNKRKQAESELIISEKKYRDIFDNAIMGIFQSTADGWFINVNQLLRDFRIQDPAGSLLKI